MGTYHAEAGEEVSFGNHILNWPRAAVKPQVWPTRVPCDSFRRPRLLGSPAYGLICPSAWLADGQMCLPHKIRNTVHLYTARLTTPADRGVFRTEEKAAPRRGCPLLRSALSVGCLLAWGNPRQGAGSDNSVPILRILPMTVYKFIDHHSGPVHAINDRMNTCHGRHSSWPRLFGSSAQTWPLPPHQYKRFRKSVLCRGDYRRFFFGERFTTPAPSKPPDALNSRFPSLSSPAGSTL